MRGRDIKRYGYDWAGLYLIATFPSKKYNIEELPAIKNHLLSFGKERLEQTGKKYNGFTARKKTNNKWFETQDSIAYWDDFDKPKIVWAELSRTGNSFVFDNSKMFLGNTGYILTANNDDLSMLYYLLGFLNSRIVLFYLDLICTRFDDNGWRWLRQFTEVIPIPLMTSEHTKELSNIVKSVDKQNQKSISENINDVVAKIYDLDKDELDYINSLLGKY